ncbi:MAG TPA: elongation factor Ts [Oceanicaulis sp.]|jgi:elongation factor Ts|uniref:Elongation factor Ts n=1 Tax=Glycocaulis albus TaxID=1382801 RepID=A0ABQ1XHQ1_9PROT|nr:translation elongation factor Ts [Glycocaulis albus]GGG93809.1 elongation factor Ts [Glycocaulis albus]HCY56735.1 elongation factor Ts [Oceanicaulis sp.]
MAEITAALVKDLRERTGAGMMDCKKALAETNGDVEAAIDWLRKKGLSKAAKKADRVAADGLVGVASLERGNGMAAAAVEVNAETDFVARNELFQAAVAEITALGVDADSVDALRQAKTKSGETVEDKLTNLIAKIGENMSLRRVSTLSVENGVVASYVHNAAADGLGKIGVLVALESTGDKAVLAELGRKVAMHVAAGSPAVALAVDVNELSADVIEREKAVFADQARQSGKPEAIIEKMVEGRLRKFYEEVVLLKQVFVFDPDLTVEGAIAAAAKDAGAPIKLTGFVRMVLGEGVEKKEEDFAAEVAALGKS